MKDLDSGCRQMLKSHLCHLTSCLTSGKPHNFSVSQFLHLKSKESSAQIKRLKFSRSRELRTSGLERTAHLLLLTNCVTLENFSMILTLSPVASHLTQHKSQNRYSGPKNASVLFSTTSLTLSTILPLTPTLSILATTRAFAHCAL